MLKFIECYQAYLAVTAFCRGQTDVIKPRIHAHLYKCLDMAAGGLAKSWNHWGGCSALDFHCIGNKAGWSFVHSETELSYKHWMIELLLCVHEHLDGGWMRCILITSLSYHSYDCVCLTYHHIITLAIETSKCRNRQAACSQEYLRNITMLSCLPLYFLVSRKCTWQCSTGTFTGKRGP